jgi:hypothetical protein
MGKKVRFRFLGLSVRKLAPTTKLPLPNNLQLLVREMDLSLIQDLAAIQFALGKCNGLRGDLNHLFDAGLAIR